MAHRMNHRLCDLESQNNRMMILHLFSSFLITITIWFVSCFTILYIYFHYLYSVSLHPLVSSYQYPFSLLDFGYMNTRMQALILESHLVLAFRTMYFPFPSLLCMYFSFFIFLIILLTVSLLLHSFPTELQNIQYFSDKNINFLLQWTLISLADLFYTTSTL